MRLRFWTLVALLLLATLSFSCGGSKKNDQSGKAEVFPTATLPATLPAPIIVTGTPRPPSGQRYVVQSGDSPASIAEEYGVSLDELLSINNITDPTGLHAGDVLIIPGAQGANGQTAKATPTARAQEQQPTSTPEETGGGQTYTVQDGDIPETIAARFGITAEELMAANNITDPSSLQIGQRLVIPTPQPTATPEG